MKIVVALMLLTLPAGARASDSARVALRQLYYGSVASGEKADHFLRVMQQHASGSDPIYKCYTASAYMLLARYLFSPYSKISYFNTGRKMLDEAISVAPADVEMRFVRFCIQTNAPAFLGYNSHIESDKRVILMLWDTLRDADLRNRIRSYLLGSVYCTETEKQRLI